MTEPERIARAKKQLILVGVSCISIIVFVLWVIHLRSTLAYAAKRAPTTSIVDSFKKTQQQLGPQWEQFRKQLQGLN